MSIGEREGLIARIRQIRRLSAVPDEPQRASPSSFDPNEPAALATRVSHLEQMLQGLQDAVHRESTRQSRRIAELEAQIQPAALGRALSEDARERGL